MAWEVAWGVDNEEASIAKEVVDARKGAQGSPFVIRPVQLRVIVTVEERTWHRGIRVSGIPWHCGLLGPGSRDVRDIGKCGGIANMIEVNVADYDGADRVWRDWAFREQIAHIFRNMRLENVVNSSIERRDNI